MLGRPSDLLTGRHLRLQPSHLQQMSERIEPMTARESRELAGQLGNIGSRGLAIVRPVGTGPSFHRALVVCMTPPAIYINAG